MRTIPEVLGDILYFCARAARLSAASIGNRIVPYILAAGRNTIGVFG
jgi:hypothetical protein